jgi:hypothetical protein
LPNSPNQRNHKENTMATQKKTASVRRRTPTQQGGPEEAGSDLMEQVRGWVDVAGGAMRRVARGAEAERELHRRRNRSGQ